MVEYLLSIEKAPKIKSWQHLQVELGKKIPVRNPAGSRRLWTKADSHGSLGIGQAHPESA